MKALRARSPSEQPKLETVTVPDLGPQDVLIKVVSAGLVPGPFEMLRQGRLSLLPTTLGHNVAGLVEEVGDLVTTIKVGQRVRVHPNLSCGTCSYCTTDRDQMCPEAGIVGMAGFGVGRMPLYEEYHDGGLAEYVRVPNWAVDILPDNVNFDVGAKVHDLGNAIRVLKVAQLLPGATILITAPTGSMGAACIKMAPFFGIGRLILVGRSMDRLEAVKNLTSIKCDLIAINDLGDDWPTTQSLVRSLRGLVPQGVDAIIDFTPTGAHKDIYQIMGGLAVNGTLVHMGGNVATLPLPLIAMMVKCWRIVGTRNHSRADAKTALRWLAEGILNIDDLITHRFKLDEIDVAIARLHDRSLPVWMMVVNP
jgi:threonine dehydrogenase-like Zn-dependent dehydrogenase